MNIQFLTSNFENKEQTAAFQNNENDDINVIKYGPKFLCISCIMFIFIFWSILTDWFIPDVILKNKNDINKDPPTSRGKNFACVDSSIVSKAA